MPMMKLCPNNHYYDSERYTSCPYCQESPVPKQSEGLEGTKPVDNHSSNSNVKVKSSEKTHAIWDNPTNPYPRVVGWLICTSGVEYGRDFRLHADNNFVGRSTDNDICLNDAHISGKHFTVTYDPLNDNYFIAMNGGKAIVYINNTPITPNQILNKGDKIRIGKTELVFVPLESSVVKWDWEQVQ